MGKKKKCKKVECPPAEKWAVPTADFFSLLLALFIALYAIASVNKEKMQAVKEEFVKIYDYTPTPEAATPVMPVDSKQDSKETEKPAGKAPTEKGGSVLVGLPSLPPSEAIEKIQQTLKDASMSVSPLDQAMDGVLLKLPVSVLFKGTDATIYDPQMQLFIRRIADIINKLSPNVDISVRGYTDDRPIPLGAEFKDNIELSIKRADAVMRELVSNGIAADRLSTAGFGSAKPVANNDTEENRAKNRRVELYMFISNDTPLDAEKQRSILDTFEKLKE